MILKVVVSGQTKKLKLSAVSFSEFSRTIALATSVPKTELVFTAINLTPPLKIVNQETFVFAHNQLLMNKSGEQLKVEVSHTKGTFLQLKPKEDTKPTEPQQKASGLDQIVEVPYKPDTKPPLGDPTLTKMPFSTMIFGNAQVVTVAEAQKKSENSEFICLLEEASKIGFGPSENCNGTPSASDLLALLKANKSKFASFLHTLASGSETTDHDLNAMTATESFYSLPNRGEEHKQTATEPADDEWIIL